MADTTPKTGLQELDPNQAQPHLTINYSLRRIDVLLQCQAKSFLGVPPGGAGEGDTYIVSGGTGLWAGHDTELVFLSNNAWQFVQPNIGWRCYVESDAAEFEFASGSPTGWAQVDSGGGGGSSTLVGLSDVDASGLSDGDALVWDADSGKFVFEPVSGGGGGGGAESLADLSDVSFGSPEAHENDVFTFKTGKWTSAPPAGGGGGGGVNPGDPLTFGLALSTASAGWNAYTMGVKMFGHRLLGICSTWKFYIRVPTGSLVVDHAVVRRTARGSTTYIDSTAVTFSGSAGGTFSGEVASDSIAVAVDLDHDYCILLFISASDPGTATINQDTAPQSGLSGGYQHFDQTAGTDFSGWSSPTTVFLYTKFVKLT